MKFNRQQRGIIFQNLPEHIKEVFTATETTRFLKEIGTNHDFSQDERTTLGKSVGLVLLGIHEPKDMQMELYQKLDKDKQIVNKIVRSVQEEIFRPIKSDLRKLDPKKLLKQAQEEDDDTDADDIPVPPPPGGGGDTPTPSYGGSSDPYREPINE